MGVGVYINISLKGYRVLKRVEREWGMVVWGCFYFILQMGEILRGELGVRLLEVGENVEPLTQLHDILVETSVLAVRSKR